MSTDDARRQHQLDYWEKLKADRKAEAVRDRDNRTMARRSVVVAMKRLRCPECQSVDVATTRTVDNDPDILSRRQRCRSCGFPFITIYD